MASSNYGMHSVHADSIMYDPDSVSNTLCVSPFTCSLFEAADM